MVRTSPSARRAGGAVGVLLAVAALSACGSRPSQPGAAAVLGDQRITVAEVQQRVNTLRAEVAAQPEGAEAEQAGLARRTVDDLVLERVVDRALGDRGLTVSPAEVQQARASDTRLLGGDRMLQRELLLRQNVSATGIDAFYREQLGIRDLAAAGGQDARTPDGDVAVRRALAQAGSELRIEVNPRYGRWDPQQVTLVAAAPDWLVRPASAAL